MPKQSATAELICGFCLSAEGKSELLHVMKIDLPILATRRLTSTGMSWLVSVCAQGGAIGPYGTLLGEI